MEVRQDTFDPNKRLIKIEPDPVSAQPEQNYSPFEKVQTFKTEYEMLDVGEIKQEFINCEGPIIEQLSDLSVKTEDTGDVREIKGTDLLPDKITIKKEASDCEIVHFKAESELLTSHCDLPTLKDESAVYPDYMEPCSSKQAEKISKSLKHTAKYFSKKKRRYRCPVCVKSFPSSKSRLDHYIRHFGKRSVNHRSSFWRRKHINGKFEKFLACSYCQCFSFNKSQFLAHFILHHCVKNVETVPLQCKRCFNVFMKQSVLNKHMETHTVKKIFKCEICSKNFNLKSSLIRHSLIHIDREPIISKPFIQKSNLIDQNQFKCEICSKQFTRKCVLVRHLKIHTGKKPFECKICSKQFTIKNSLNTHSTIHAGEKPFKCDICLKLFNRKYYLESHLKVHTDETPFKCEICSKQFKHKSNFKKHLNVHTGKKPFRCEICSKQFTAKFSLATHLKIHTGEQLFKCEICLKAFTRKSNLNSHLKLHTNTKPCKCEMCSKQFTRKYDLVRHLKIHTGEKPFECKICLKQFTLKSNLNIHSIIHTLKQPFKCEICLRTFTRKSNLSSHLRLHTDDKPFKCEICSKQFKYKSSLKSHLEIHNRTTKVFIKSEIKF